MKNIIILIVLFFFVLIVVSILISRIITKKFAQNKKEQFFSKAQYNKCCKQRTNVLNNIPITFDAHCKLKTESDIYSFYDKTIEEGICELKNDCFSISIVGSV